MRKVRPEPLGWQVAKLEFKSKHSSSRKSPHYDKAKQAIACFFFEGGEHMIESYSNNIMKEGFRNTKMVTDLVVL